VGGFLGFNALLAEVPVSFGTILAFANKIAATYHIDITNEDTQIEILKAITAGSSSSLEIKNESTSTFSLSNIVIQKVSWGSLASGKIYAGNSALIVVKQILKTLGVGISRRKAAQFLPGLGAVTGGLINGGWANESLNAVKEYCRYTVDQNIEKLEHLMSNFIRYIESEHPVFTRHEIMYDTSKVNTQLTKQYITEKTGFLNIERTGLTITAPWRQNETVDLIIDNRLNISMKTAYKSSKSSFSFTIKGRINIHLCDYVFAITPMGVVIFTSEEVYSNGKKSFCWKIDSKPIISLICLRDVSSKLPLNRKEHLYTVLDV
jgi:hypothetical protein